VNITPKTYERKPFTVQAIRVTDANMQEVARWCHGTVVPGVRAGKQLDCIEVDVKNPINEKQKKAFAGDWVLKGSSGWKVYTSRAFNGCFVERMNVTAQELLQDFLPLPPSEDELAADVNK
jgi:hypothetical protein